MKIALGILAYLLLQSAPALGEKNADTTYECKNGKLVREVLMAVGVEESGDVGCSVIYRKVTEIGPNHNQELWSAPKGKDFCMTKLSGFVEKLKGMGWTCAKT